MPSTRRAGTPPAPTVNLALKSGTNSIRGAGGYFNRDASRTATPLLTQRAGGTKPTRTYNRFTGQVGGPVLRNRTFFMMAYEHLRDVQPEPSTFTVPTEKMRVGDFSEFTTLIHDPLTATGSTRARTPFDQNKIPSGRIDPVAANYAALYPLPNRPGTVSNYFTNMLRPYDYDAIMGRVDHNFSGNDRAFVSLYYNTRQEDRYNWAAEATNATNNGTINNVLVTQGFDYRSNRGLTLGYTTSRFAMWVVDVRYSNTTFGEYRDPAANVDPASLGFAPSAVQAMQGYQYLPMITFAAFSTTNQNSTIATLGSQRSDWNAGFNRPMATQSFSPTLTRIWGDHNVKLGYELRHQNWLIESAAYGAGRYHFNGFFTRASNSAGTNDRAQSFAQFLLGLPTVGTNTVATSGSTGSQFEIASPGEFSQRTQGIFIQDDWQVTDRLSLNLGVRLEFNGGMTEKSDRNLGGFDTVTPNPLDAQARAAYANNPIPQIPGVGVRRDRRTAVRGWADQQEQGQGAAACRGGLPHRRAHGDPGRHRAVLLRLLLREHQPGGLRAADAGSGEHRRRSDVYRRDAEQPAAVRAADSAGWLGQRPDELARSGPRHALPAGT